MELEQAVENWASTLMTRSYEVRQFLRANITIHIHYSVSITLFGIITYLHFNTRTRSSNKELSN